MKKALLLLAILAYNHSIFAQNSPQAFNYQFIVRNNSGQILANEDIELQISILNNSNVGETLYTEYHLVSTNNSGIANLQIGQGELTYGNFTTINWAEGSKWLKIELNQSGNYITIGIMQLLSVPYALYAATAGTTGPAGSIISCGSNNSNYTVRGNGSGNWVCDDFMQISPNGIGINTTPSTSFDLKIYGNLGIGYSPTSSYDLSIDGNAKISDYLSIGSSTSSSYNLDVDGDARIQDWLGVGSSTSSSYKVDVDGDVRIQDGLGIGTSPPYSGLYVGSSYNFYVKTSMNSGSGNPLVISSGEVKEQSYSNTKISNIQPLVFSKEKILALSPKQFCHSEDKGGDGSIDIGLIAEETALIDSNLVIYNDKLEVIGVKHDKLSLFLLEIIKEQETRIDALEKELLKLKQ